MLVNSEKVSVIVPIYNVEKYLAKCVESIVAQTYCNLEIILVDDGSTDLSGSICDEFSERDNRIIVIHKNNGGLSDARNEGIIVSTGDYICFIDSDDWIEPYTIQSAVEAIADVDIVVWGYYKDLVDENDAVITSFDRKTDALITKNGGYKILLQPGVMEEVGYAWNKLYRAGLIKQNGFLFEKGLSLVEDTVFNYPLFLECDFIRMIDYQGTHYISRSRTTLGTKYYPNRIELKRRVATLMKELLCYFGAPQEIAQSAYESFLISAFRGTIRGIAQLKEPFFERRHKMKNLLSEDIVKVIVKEYRASRFIDWLIIQIARLRLIALLIMIEGRIR